MTATKDSMDQKKISPEHFFWALQNICALYRKPFSQRLIQQFIASPHNLAGFKRAGEQLGFNAKLYRLKPEKIHASTYPLVVWLSMPTDVSFSDTTGDQLTVALVLQADASQIMLIEPGATSPRTIPLSAFVSRYCGYATSMEPQPDLSGDLDSQSEASQRKNFGFRWFIPELLKHKKLWHEVLLASLAIQLIALATPLFTQAIIDKVIVHRTQSTLVVLAIGMLIFMLFSAGLSWLRQYLVLHTGNRVDAVLGSAVFEHLFKLPPQYFQHRPTGVIAARLHGVETIREFISSAAVTLVLDLPFLIAFVAIMFYYSVTLTLVVSIALVLIVGLSILVAPRFQLQLQQQFQLGARNQAFLTEYISGLETVKSLQLEAQLNSRYSSYLASYLAAGFSTKQLANSYHTAANLLEQIMNLMILSIGAYTVMHSNDFTIGMLVAFQMFSGRLSQPMLRLVGLWQQFQQASLSVARLGDLMNAPIEPYSAIPSRVAQRKGAIVVDAIAFKYADHLPLIYQNLSFEISAGQTVAIMGPSGCGKSTLAKLMQGFYQPYAGRLLIDGVDIRYLSANELRSNFGVVPQDTILFSGTIYDNLQMASPVATFDQIVAACHMAEVHGVIEALPQGYQTQIGERGAGLSGGQRQRIAIARALLKRPNILIFDEATSALDSQTAEQFSNTINALRGKVTMLFITHGLPKGLKVDALYRLGPDGAHRVILTTPTDAKAAAR